MSEIQLTFSFKDSSFIPTGKELKRKGMKKALNHAEDINDGWSERALNFLEWYCKSHHRFSGEMVRIEAKGNIPNPPSLRAWGSVLLSGCRRGWITQVGFVHVKNVKAHCANAALWESKIINLPILK
jgi:hypothetical protein